MADVFLNVRSSNVAKRRTATSARWGPPSTFDEAAAVAHRAAGQALLLLGRMLRRPRGAILAAAWALVLWGSQASRAVDDVAGEPVLLNDNGGWSWFQDERAIVDPAAGKLLASSVANQDGPGGIARHGDVEVATLDLASGEVSRFTLHDGLQADDHNSAALMVRPDGRYLAMYARHGTDSFTRYRVSTGAGQTSSWGPEQSWDNGISTTYSNLHRLSAESGRWYNFTRTVGFDPNVTISDDQGQRWSYGGRLLDWPRPEGDPKYTGSDGSRPYLKYASDGVDEIHFIASEDHPRAYDNSIYHGVMRADKVYDSFGQVIDDDIFDDAARKPNDYTPVFDTDSSPLGHAWTTDLELDAEGLPYALFTARAGDTDDHRFLYGRFDGQRWHVHEIAKAGGFLYAPEFDYTGLGALDPERPERVFISTNIDPRTQDALSHYEIFQGRTDDQGATWTWSPITFNSTRDNLRPVVPEWDDQHTALLWMRGTYSTYTSYDTSIMALTDIAQLKPLAAGDLDQDGDVDLDDFSLFLQGMHADLAGMTPAEARRRGDLNGDLANDYQDFRLFRQAFDTAHGAGALAAIEAATVPEPRSAAVLVAGGLGSLMLQSARLSAPRPAAPAEQPRRNLPRSMATHRGSVR